MHLLEICCGENASISRVAKELGWHVTTLDWNPKVSGLEGCPHLCCDVREFDYTAHRPLPQVVWCSPDCREISQNRQSKPGDVVLSDSVSAKCLEICLYFRDRGAACFIENPIQALPKRPHMRAYEKHLRAISYCKYSAPRPDNFQPSPPSKQQLGDWFPYKKHTAIYDLSETGWVPRPRCRKDCEWLNPQRVHYSWARNGQDKEQIIACKEHCYPYVLTAAELHRVPRALCLELLEAAKKKAPTPKG